MINHYNCIYMYTNKINGKRYVGQTKNFNKRHKQHIMKSSNKAPIDRAFNKYGKDNFEIKILAEDVPTQEKLNEYEKFFIKRYKTLAIENGYNIADGGSNGNPYAGKTEEEMKKIRDRISELKSGENNYWYNKQRPDQSKRMKGKNNPMYGKCGKDAPAYGKKRSKESIQKQSDSIRGGKHHNSKKITSRVVNKVKDGDIVLMHDIYSATSNALDNIIPMLVNKGYSFVTVSDLFYYKGITLEKGKVYGYAR